MEHEALVPHEVWRADGQEDDTCPHDDPDAAAFNLKFSVATLLDLQQRAYIDPNAGGGQGRVEWLLVRLHNFLGIAKEPHRMLKENMPSLHKVFGNMSCSVEEIHYRGLQCSGGLWKDHTLESRAFLLFLLWVLQNRPLNKQVKFRALRLLLAIVALAFTAASAAHAVQVSANILAADGSLINKALNFTDQQVCVANFAELLQHSPAGCKLWEELRRTLWLGYCISTELAQASLQDMFYYMAWLLAHPSRKIMGKQLSKDIAMHAMPMLIVVAGAWLNKLARLKAAESLQSLPILRSKTGQLHKAVDPINRMILMWKLRKEKLHRQRTAATHDNLVSPNTAFAKYENALDTYLHQAALHQCMRGHPKQVTVSWDPSSYGGKEVMVVIGYSKHIQRGFYLLNQWLSKMRLSDLDDSLIQAAREKIWND